MCYYANMPKPLDLSSEEIASIVTDYDRGVPLKQIVAAHDLGSTTSVYSVLTRARHTSRRRRPYKERGRTRYVDKGGYVKVRVPRDWPFRAYMRGSGGDGRWVFEHRKVMAEALGRPLKSVEQVHHINGDRGDNRLENLQLVHGAHGSGITMRCNVCGSHDVEAIERQ